MASSSFFRKKKAFLAAAAALGMALLEETPRSSFFLDQ